MARKKVKGKSFLRRLLNEPELQQTTAMTAEGVSTGFVEGAKIGALSRNPLGILIGATAGSILGGSARYLNRREKLRQLGLL
jgi:uncharacterized membrane protein